MGNNPQAFPLASYEGWDLTEIDGQPGMSLRDYFAAKAISSVYKKAMRNIGFYSESQILTELAKDCYKIADAMLNERSKQNEG